MRQQHTLLCGQIRLVTYVDTCFLHKIFCGRVSEGCEFPTLEMIEVMVGGMRKQWKSHFTHKAWRWLRVKGHNESLVNMIDEEEKFNFYPHVFTP